MESYGRLLWAVFVKLPHEGTAVVGPPSPSPDKRATRIVLYMAQRPAVSFNPVLGWFPGPVRAFGDMPMIYCQSRSFYRPERTSKSRLHGRDSSHEPPGVTAGGSGNSLQQSTSDS